jgi:chromosome segregation ATPase
VADGAGGGSWTLDKIGVPLFIGVVSSFGAWLVTWGSMSNQVANMDELLRELRPGLVALTAEVHDLELTGSRGLQDFRAAINARLEGVDRVLDERNKRLSEVESKVLLLTERQGQTVERIAEMNDQTRANREAARVEHEALKKGIADQIDAMARNMSYSGNFGTSMQPPSPGARPPR